MLHQAQLIKDLACVIKVKPSNFLPMIGVTTYTSVYRYTYVKANIFMKGKTDLVITRTDFFTPNTPGPSIQVFDSTWYGGGNACGF
jgi:hypothetical protein